MSDLQCPATFLLVPADADPQALTEATGHLRVAEVVAARTSGAGDLARRLAAAHGLPVPAAASLDAESYREVLTGLADLRRGETTVVVVDPALLVLVAGREEAPPLLEVLVDADGWVVREASLAHGRAGLGGAGASTSCRTG